MPNNQKPATLDEVIKNDFNAEKHEFYKTIISFMQKHKYQFLIGGGLAVREYAPSVSRPMHDLDLFIKAGDAPKILQQLSKEGFKSHTKNEQWLAKATKGKHFVDFIFSSPNGMNPVNDSWFEGAREVKLFGKKLPMIPPEELIWCKAYIQSREKNDSADINHLILYQAQNINWKSLLQRMEQHWELLLYFLISFRFVYPSERGLIPKWLMTELLERAQAQLENPIPKEKICRGMLLSGYDYQGDIVNDFLDAR